MMGKRGPTTFTWEDSVASFWSRVDRQGPNDCWPWQGATTFGGYGVILVMGKRIGAHRFSLELDLGRPLREKYCALHICDNPVCVNPEHLWEGTKSDNSKDMIRKGRGGPPHGLGEKSSRHKLTAREVRIIKMLYRKGLMNQVQLAAAYGITQASISAILRGLNWKHIK